MTEITRKTCGPDFKAKLDGECKRKCGNRIRANIDFVTKVDGVDGIFHSHCGRAYCNTVNENLLENDAA